MEDYSAKLTGEPFLYIETKIIAEYLLNGENPIELKRRNIEENLIHYKKTESDDYLCRNSVIFYGSSILHIQVSQWNTLKNFASGSTTSDRF